LAINSGSRPSTDDPKEAEERESHVFRLLSLLRLISDENRLRILGLLMQREMCVCELMEVLDLGQSLVSHHLGLLKGAGLVSDRRDAQWVYYSISPEAVARMNVEYASFFDLAKIGREASPGSNTRCQC
jgi:DNA-binding transcriptional ArsR family regulator